MPSRHPGDDVGNSPARPLNATRTVDSGLTLGPTRPWHEPLLPSIPGRLDGPMFHSSRADHSVDLTGKRVPRRPPTFRQSPSRSGRRPTHLLHPPTRTNSPSG
ncbi:hypothetical protein E0H92_18560 [Kribbella speibonae]|uniref:Uncharacterized protein n=1 Tax=Kribbella speibonae TaxID=1572660 RepID=A0A4R0IZK3_9ACTN|nr:hypothetical protein E0H92_18560 [Kribbella speibonae]